VPKFSKLKMPSKQEKEMPEMDYSELELSESEEMPKESKSDLSTLSDEELMAEVEKRGLMKELEAPSKEMPEEEESYS